MANSAKSARSELVLALALSIVCALGVCVFGVCASGAGAQSFSEQHAKIALLAEDGALNPGQTAWIGLFFDIDRAGTFTGSIPAIPARRHGPVGRFPKVFERATFVSRRRFVWPPAA